MQSFLLRILIIGVASAIFIQPVADANTSDQVKRAKVQIKQLNGVIFLLAAVLSELIILSL
jgi:hypothetical protein